MYFRPHQKEKFVYLVCRGENGSDEKMNSFSAQSLEIEAFRCLEK